MCIANCVWDLYLNNLEFARFEVLTEALKIQVFFDMIPRRLPETRRHDVIYLSTAVGLTPGGSSTIHIYTQTIHRTTQITIAQNNVNQGFSR